MKNRLIIPKWKSYFDICKHHKKNDAPYEYEILKHTDIFSDSVFAKQTGGIEDCEGVRVQL
jgi:hypothetical protein